MRPDRSGRHPWRRSFGRTQEFLRPDPARDRGRRRARLAVRAAAALVATALVLAAVWAVWGVLRALA